MMISTRDEHRTAAARFYAVIAVLAVHLTSRTIIHRIVVPLGGLFCVLLLLPATATADEKLWALLQSGGQVAIAAETGASPGTSELVVVTPWGDGELTVAGRLVAYSE